MPLGVPAVASAENRVPDQVRRHGVGSNVAVRLARMGGPTAGQVESYQRDGFLIVERFLETSDLERIRAHFMSVFEHEWETGLAPDEVNYVPGVTAPDLTRQLCNVWKADRVLAGVTLSRQVGEFATRLAGLPGVRLAVAERFEPLPQPVVRMLTQSSDSFAELRC